MRRMKPACRMALTRLPFACHFVRSSGGFVYRFRGGFPYFSQRNGKYGGKLLILKGRNRTGSHEVRGSIPLSSTNRINNLADSPPFSFPFFSPQLSLTLNNQSYFMTL